MNRKFLRYLILIFFIAVLSSGFFIFQSKKNENTNYFADLEKSSLKQENKEIVLIFVGDIMLDRGIEYMVKKYGGGDFSFPFSQIAGELQEADVVFGNLESVISDKGSRAGSIYSFRAEPEAIEGLIFAGFDVLSVGNNHIFDYGKEAMEDSFKRLNEAGINYVGGGFNEKEAHSPVVKEAKGTKIAFLAYTNLGSEKWAAKENSSGIAWLDDMMEKDIGAAKERADLVVVSLHFGEEYQSKSNSEQKLFSRLAIDSGADLVVGHHPHVVQEIEKHKDGYIVYSLGNFIFDQGFSEETMRGLLLKVLVKDGKIKEVIPIDIKINQFFRPEITESF